MKTPRVLPPHYFFGSLITMLALGYYLDGSVLPRMWRLVGIVPIAVGLAFAVTAIRQFTKAETNIVPLSESTTLVTEGIFTVSRNPMYVGMLATLTGVAVLLNGPWPWLVIVPFWVILRLRFVRSEETLMEQTFREPYRQYRARVRRWL